MSEQQGKGGALDSVLAVVVLVLLLATTWLYVFAVPKCAELFEDLDVDLPRLTGVLLDVSSWIRVNWLFLALILLMVSGPIMALGRGGVRTVFLTILALTLALVLVGGLLGVYLPARRLLYLLQPAPASVP